MLRNSHRVPVIKDRRPETITQQTYMTAAVEIRQGIVIGLNSACSGEHASS